MGNLHVTHFSKKEVNICPIDLIDNRGLRVTDQRILKESFFESRSKICV